MAAILQEADVLLGGHRPDQDSLTRAQQKKIEAIFSEKPTPKKVRISKATTMLGTAKVLDFSSLSSYPSFVARFTCCCSAGVFLFSASCNLLSIQCTLFQCEYLLCKYY